MTAASPPARSKAQLCQHPSGSAQPCSPNKATHTRLDPPWPLQHRSDGAVAPGEQERGHGSTSPHSWEDAGQPQPPSAPSPNPLIEFFQHVMFLGVLFSTQPMVFLPSHPKLPTSSHCKPGAHSPSQKAMITSQKKTHQEVAGPRKMGQNLNPFQPKSLIHSHPGSSGLCPAPAVPGILGDVLGIGVRRGAHPLPGRTPGRRAAQRASWAGKRQRGICFKLRSCKMQRVSDLIILPFPILMAGTR